MTSTPRVSVVIPTHNRSGSLVEAVASVLAQTFGDHEILVCDDGSTDDTAARMAALSSSVRYLRLDHTGSPARTRNAGIARARGALVAFLDDDDVWHPRKLALQVAALDADPGAGLSYTDAELLQPDGTVVAGALSVEERGDGRLFARLLRNCFIHPSTAVVRRDVLARTGPFDPGLHISEDYDLWLRLARVTRAVCVPEPLARVRRQPGSHSERSGARAYEDAIRAVARHVAGDGLSLGDRIRCRAALARLHTGAAAAAARDGDAASARSQSLRALRLNPLRPGAWSALVRRPGAAAPG